MGTWFDETLDFNKHVLTKCKAASWNLKCIRMLRYLIDQESYEILMCSLVLLHLNYGNGKSKGSGTCSDLLSNDSET